MKNIRIYSFVSLCGALIAGVPAIAQTGGQGGQASPGQGQTTERQDYQRGQQQEQTRGGQRQQVDRHERGQQYQGEQQDRTDPFEQRRDYEPGQDQRDDFQQRETRRDQTREERVDREQARTQQEGAEIILREEQLHVERQEVPLGGVILRKRVVSEDASETVELRYEDIEVIRLSPEEAQERMTRQGDTGFDEPFAEGEIFIPLMREEAHAQMDVSVREVIQAEPRVEVEEEEIRGTVRHEEVDIERVGEQSERYTDDRDARGQQRAQDREQRDTQDRRTQQRGNP